MSHRSRRSERSPWCAGAAALALAALVVGGLPACAAAEVATQAGPPRAVAGDLAPGLRAAAAAGRRRRRSQVGGRSRALITVVPASYRPAEPHALVVAFHGRTNSNAEARRYYDLERHAREPTIFVYPSALRERAGSFAWSEPEDPPGALRDFALFDAVLALIARSYCIDPARIFAVGHSLGAWFVNSLGCARGDALRAIATLAGGIGRSRLPGRRRRAALPQSEGPPGRLPPRRGGARPVPRAERSRGRRAQTLRSRASPAGATAPPALRTRWYGAPTAATAPARAATIRTTGRPAPAPR